MLVDIMRIVYLITWLGIVFLFPELTEGLPKT